MRVRWSTLLLGLLLVVAACTSGDGDDDSVEPAIVARPTVDVAAGEPTPTPRPEGRVTDRFTLEPGMCFNRYDIYSPQLDEITEFTTEVDCLRRHDGEVYAPLEYPSEAEDLFPGNSEIQRWANLACYERFEEFVGTPYELSALEIGTIQPTEDDWEGEEGLVEPERTVLCFVFAPDNQLEGAMQNSGF